MNITIQNVLGCVSVKMVEYKNTIQFPFMMWKENRTTTTTARRNIHRNIQLKKSRAAAWSEHFIISAYKNSPTLRMRYVIYSVLSCLKVLHKCINTQRISVLEKAPCIYYYTRLYCILPGINDEDILDVRVFFLPFIHSFFQSFTLVCSILRCFLFTHSLSLPPSLTHLFCPFVCFTSGRALKTQMTQHDNWYSERPVRF